MAFKLPPPPQSNDLKGSAWQDWFYKLQAAFTTLGSILWGSIDFTGSNLTDLVTRNHNDLQNIQGGAPGDYQHLTTAQVAIIGSATWSTIDFTGSNITDILTRNHNDLQNIQGGAVGDYQHLTTAQVTAVGTIGTVPSWILAFAAAHG